MVFIKASNGVETRRFQVTPGEVTYEQLQEKLATLFPSSMQGDKPLTLQYRDSDGDLITLSSDEELQGVLSTLSSDAVWKIWIRRAPAAPKSRPAQHGQSLFDLLFEPRSTNIWGHFDKQFKQTESLFQQLLGRALEDDCCTEGTECSTECCNTDTEAKEDKTESSAEQTDTTEQTEASTDDGDTVKSKLDDQPAKSKEAPAVGCCKKAPVHRETVVSWEPRIQHTWFGPRTVWRPVRYNVLYWGQSDAAKKEEAAPKATTDQTTPQPQETTA